MKETRDQLEKLNIAVVSVPLPLHHRAVEVLMTLLLGALTSLSQKIYLITGNFPEEAISDSKVQIQNISYNTRSDWIPVKVAKHIAMQFKISYHLFKRRKDIDVALFWMGSTLVLPLLTLKMLRKRTVVVATGSQAQSGKIRSGPGRIIWPRVLGMLEKLSFLLADRVAVESEHNIDFLGLHRFRKKIVPGAALYVDPGLFRVKTDWKERENLIGYVGRLAPEKGVTNFVLAIPALLKERPDSEFILCGDGLQYEEIKGLLERTHLTAKVKLTRWVPHNELPDYFNQMKLLVLPSYTEGLPSVVLEAMACGVPVLATPVGGIIGLVRDEVTGFLLKDNAPDSIARGAIRALNHPRLEETVERAHALVLKEYTYDCAVKRFANILAQQAPWKEDEKR